MIVFAKSNRTSLRVRLETQAALANRRVRSMTEAAFRHRGSHGCHYGRADQHRSGSGPPPHLHRDGEAVDGDPRHSYGNIVRFGFEESRLRQNFAPAPST